MTDSNSPKTLADLIHALGEALELHDRIIAVVSLDYGDQGKELEAINVSIRKLVDSDFETNLN